MPATTQAPATTPEAFLGSPTLDLAEFAAFRREMTGSIAGWRALRAATESIETKVRGAARMKTAFLLHLVGRTDEAIALWEAAEDAPLRAALLARAYMEAGRMAEADPLLKKHQDADPAVALLRVESLRRLGKTDEAFALLKEIGAEHEKTADYRYQLGACHEAVGDHRLAMACYEEAVEADPAHAASIFRLAYLNDTYGDAETALALYERLSELEPTYVHALVNLGMKYEDFGLFDEAIECYRRVVQVQPKNLRARLYLKDAESSLHMLYDEDKQRRQDKHSQILRIPITDFELSVRTRNCLKKLNINTLGDLVRMSEQELLSEKNFGETSLQEVKEMLAQKGLRLGLAQQEPVEVDPAILAKSVSEIDLSVRSRKCMEKLGVKSIGELIQKTEAELLAAKNFGQTSLTEVKQRLTEMGLSLRES